MKLTNLHEAKYAVSYPQQASDWISRKEWNALSNEHRYLVASHHETLDGIIEELIEQNQNWIDLHGDNGDGWEIGEQASNTEGWDDLPDKANDDNLNWIDPILELLKKRVWAHEYNYDYYEEFGDEDDEGGWA